MMKRLIKKIICSSSGVCTLSKRSPSDGSFQTGLLCTSSFFLPPPLSTPPQKLTLAFILIRPNEAWDTITFLREL